MIEIIDMSKCQFSHKNGYYGGAAGSKDGVIYNGELWMIKFPKNIKDLPRTGNASYSTGSLCEFLGSHIYEILGIPSHETHLVYRKGKLAVACKDFAVDKLLLELRTIKNHENEHLEYLLERDFQGTGSHHFVDLEELLLHLKYNDILNCIPGIEERFWEQVIIDIFINNNDRNNGNWGILRSKNQDDELAPVFDNGGCLQTKISESKIIRMLEDTELIRKNASNIQTSYAINGKVLSVEKMLNFAINYPQFCEVAIRLIPKIKERFSEIEQFFKEIPYEYEAPDGSKILIMSEERKKLYLLQMEARIDNLLEPFLEKCIQQLEIQRE